MKVQTGNRLAHLQVELQELIEQTNYLKLQIQPKQMEIANLENYLKYNNGDRRISSDYRKACNELRSLMIKINTNNRKITKLNFRIQQEGMRIQGYHPTVRKRY